MKRALWLALSLLMAVIILTAVSCGEDTATTTTGFTTAPATTPAATTTGATTTSPVTTSPTTTAPVPTTTGTTPPGVVTTTPAEMPATDVEVSIENYEYVPPEITVAAGATVTWTNKDSVMHTVTDRNDLFDSGLLGMNESYSYTFNQPGEYEYYCIPHPYMVGEVIVE